MKSVISTTYDDKYLYFLPLCVWAWNKLGVDVICFLPEQVHEDAKEKLFLVSETLTKYKALIFSLHFFDSPIHKEATYAQCSRLYAACLDLPEDEILVIGDVDMAVFKKPPYNGGFTILGHDLVPENQYPMCYVSAKVKDWRDSFNLNELSYQQAIDRLLKDDECQDYRACRWSVDQEQMSININENAEFVSLCNRSNGQNQFATKRYDRDDSFILDRLSPDTIDFHMNRPGYEPKHFEIILTILKYHYPEENFDWLISYTEKYRTLL